MKLTNRVKYLKRLDKTWQKLHSGWSTSHMWLLLWTTILTISWHRDKVPTTAVCLQRSEHGTCPPRSMSTSWELAPSGHPPVSGHQCPALTSRTPATSPSTWARCWPVPCWSWPSTSHPTPSNTSPCTCTGTQTRWSTSKRWELQRLHNNNKYSRVSCLY